MQVSRHSSPSISSPRRLLSANPGGFDRRRQRVRWFLTEGSPANRLISGGSLTATAMGRRQIIPVHPEVRRLLGYDEDESDQEILRHWKSTATRVCKPCWELRYCPYGPLVELSPLLPPTRKEATEHNDYLKETLRTGYMANSEPVDSVKRKRFQAEIDEFNPEDYPENIPQEISELACTIFGHICPVVFAAEKFTESSESRRTGRYIPFQTKIRVVRRDNYTCQHCQTHLNDNEVEFDHLIPLSKGGSSDEHNIRLTCHDCNADKSDKIDI